MSPMSPLQEREEIVSALCIFVRWAPILGSVVFVAASAIVGIQFTAEGILDRAALTVAITIAPCVALAWMVRHLVLQLLELLDLPQPADDTPRH